MIVAAATSLTPGVQPSVPDRFSGARLVADAVLYEGYVLYPYRASAQKNQMRWQFGVLTPAEHARSCGSERSSMRSEVVVDPGNHASLTVRIRCLQVQQRTVESGTDDDFVAVHSLDVEGRMVVPWDEAVEHEIDVPVLRLVPIGDARLEYPFVLEAADGVELVRNATGATVGRILRHREHVDGMVRIAARRAGGEADGEESLLHVTIEVDNSTEWNQPGADRDAAMLRSLVAVHTLMGVDDASFVSLLDPPADAERAVAACTSVGTFPVLIGGEHTSDVMLSSPIILYDCPSVAPESVVDFCDATEIDEILALRVMTLTDSEKAEARGTDPRSAAIIDRCEDMPEELWTRMHGAIRSLDPRQPSSVVSSPDPVLDVVFPTIFGPGDTGAGDTGVVTPAEPWWDPGQDASFDPFSDTMRIGAHNVGAGTRVRLVPSRRADAQDIFYVGQLATVKGVFNDVDGNQHVAVVLDEDPASEMFDWQGRYLYFHPDEIEVQGAVP